MGKHVLLDNVEHKKLRVRTDYAPEFGHNVTCVPAFMTEFEDLQREYPIFFQKDAEGKFQAVIFLGISEHENLFLSQNEYGYTWRARYVPAILSKGPFLIGYQDQRHVGGNEKAPVIHIDLDDQRVSEEGELLFTELGGNSAYLKSVSVALEVIRSGVAQADEMFAEFQALGLIESVNLDVKLDTGELHQITNNYTIDPTKLAQLGATELERLNKTGYLRAAYAVVMSLANMQKLVEWENARRM